jgi:flagellar L-ring protein precursor FlgH
MRNPSCFSVTLFCLAALLLSARGALADSLFSDPDPGKDPVSAGLYSKHPVILAEGDTVRIRVREKSTGDVSNAVNTKDESKQDVSLGRTGGLLGRVFSPFLKLLGQGDVTFDSKSEFKGDGSTKRSVRMDSVVTALVVGVLDNGCVLIEGRKKVTLNSEEQTLIVRGTLNPRDLDKDLVVDSERIADVEIEYAGEGQLSKHSKPGFLSRVVDFLF